MALTKTLLSAVPYVPGGDLRRHVDSWDLIMSFQAGVSGDSDFFYKEYQVHIPYIIIDRHGVSSKAAADFSLSALESLCPIEQWTADFYSLTAAAAAEEIEADYSYTLPS